MSNLHTLHLSFAFVEESDTFADSSIDILSLFIVFEADLVGGSSCSNGAAGSCSSKLKNVGISNRLIRKFSPIFWSSVKSLFLNQFAKFKKHFVNEKMLVLISRRIMTFECLITGGWSLNIVSESLYDFNTTAYWVWP